MRSRTKSTASLVAVSKIALYAEDPAAYEANGGRARNKKAISHGNKAHREVVSSYRTTLAIVILTATAILVLALI